MTTRNTPFAPGTPCWVDLLSSDVEKAKAFYTGLFGWTAQDAGAEFGGYVTFRSDGNQVAGLMGNSGDNGSPDVWATYISTSDIDATIATATAAGGQVVVPPMAVGDLGSMAMLSDPAGAVFGVWQPGGHTGFEKYNEPGSVTWDENHSKNFAATTPFYAELFGWQMEKTSDNDEFRYYQGQIDGETVAGLMDSASFLPAEVPSHWAVYFSVVDADEAAAKAKALGGAVVSEPQDTPFGRVADLADPTGVPFKIHSTKMANG